MPFKINATLDFLLLKGNLIAAIWLGVAGAVNLSDGKLIQYDNTFQNWYTYQWDNDPRYGFSYNKGILEITTTGLTIVVL